MERSLLTEGPPASERLEAALALAAGGLPGGSVSADLCCLCERLVLLCQVPVASVYVLEGPDELVLRGNQGFDRREVLGEVRLKVGEGITGRAVALQRPLLVADAETASQFAYFPQLSEERYPVFLAIPLLSGDQRRGALVLQRASGGFSEPDVLLAVACARAVTAVIEAEHPHGANLLFHGTGNQRGRALGVAHLLTRALPRRPRKVKAEPADQAHKALAKAFADERSDLRGILDRAREALPQAGRQLEEIGSMLEDARLEERAREHLASGIDASLALERIAAECARALLGQGPAARRAVDVESFLGAVAHRLAGVEAPRMRRGEMLVGVHLSGLAALRAWSQGATGAVCAGEAQASSGCGLFTALGLPLVSSVKQLFEGATSGVRLAIDSGSGEVFVNPTAAQAAAWRAGAG